MTLLLGHEKYGKMVMASETLAPNQWIGHNGVRYGTFRTLKDGIYVALPISEVTILV